MGREHKKILFTDKGVFGNYRIGEFKSGKHGKRIKLCSRDEYESINKDRRAKYLDDLYNRKLQDLLLTENIKRKQKEEEFKKERLLSSFGQQWLTPENFESDRTLKDYAKSFEYYISAIGDTQIDAFSKLEYSNKFRGYLSKLGHSRNTIHKHFRNIQTFYFWIEDHELAPLYKLRKPKKTIKEHRTLTPEQLVLVKNRIWEKFLESGRSDHKRGYRNLLLAYTVACETAMRAGEIQALKLEDIDLENRKIYIVDHEQDGHYVKGGHEEYVEITDDLAELLNADFQLRSDEEVWFLDYGSGKKFYTNDTHLARPIGEIYKELGIKGVKPFHGIRSSVITILLQSGHNLAYVQKFARHKDIATTRKYLESLKLDTKGMLDQISNATQMPHLTNVVKYLQQLQLDS